MTICFNTHLCFKLLLFLIYLQITKYEYITIHNFLGISKNIISKSLDIANSISTTI